MKKRAQTAKKVLEELCFDAVCPRRGTHWHPFSAAALLQEKPGEYTITVRVRRVKKTVKR